MVDVNVNPKEQTADFALEKACVSCGGTLEIRVTPGNGAWGYCAACHVLSRPELVVDGHRLSFAATLKAAA
jgi:hypothetical protein